MNQTLMVSVGLPFLQRRTTSESSPDIIHTAGHGSKRRSVSIDMTHSVSEVLAAVKKFRLKSNQRELDFTRRCSYSSYFFHSETSNIRLLQVQIVV